MVQGGVLCAQVGARESVVCAWALKGGVMHMVADLLMRVRFQCVVLLTMLQELKVDDDVMVDN